MPVARPDLFEPAAGASHVALAVSGGSDSIALAVLARRTLGRRLSALTVDHGLRVGATEEALRVAGWMAQLGIDHHILRWEGPKPSSGIQAKARAARYHLMVQWCRDHGADILLTGHTLDDQAETVLMRMARTSSADSLAGIPRHGQWTGFPLLRPLIGERRQALRALLTGENLSWIDDPSNEDQRFERVRIRTALPALAEIGITVETLGAIAVAARKESDALWSAAHEWVRQNGETHETGYCSLPADAFLEQAEALRPRILKWFISRFGGGKSPELAELQTLAAWIGTGQLGRRTLGGAIIARQKAEIVIGREPARIATKPVQVPPGGRVVWDGRFEIVSRPGSLVTALGGDGPAPRRKDIPAFVQASLPVIRAPGGGLAVPGLGQNDNGLARFLHLNSP